jgi:GNAT superfamily N-acetyltransferase
MPPPAIRPCRAADTDAVVEIVNDAACAYRGVIPADCWHEPYMPRSAVLREIRDGVRFWGWEDAGGLVGVMGIQDVGDVSLVRHAYVRTASRRSGVGRALIQHLRGETRRPMLVGTWRAATWAVAFYQKHGFRLVSTETKDRLLRAYWDIPERQVETSVVLADERFLRREGLPYE